MREIITLQVGGSGNNICEVFWKVIANEHGISPTGHFVGNSYLQADKLDVYFNESGNGNVYARTICADTDPSSVRKLLDSPMSMLYSPDSFITGSEGTGNNFAKGRYTEGAEIVDDILDRARLEAESVDSLQGFQVVHSLGGGTGSGLSSLLYENIAQEYPDNMVMSFAVIPSHKQSDVVVEPYNSILGLPQLMSNTHLTFCIDNEALHDICVRTLKAPGATLRDMNHIVAHTMSGVTTCFRFPGQLNSGLRKLYVNMVPMPNLHFFVPGFAPLTSCDRVPYQKLSVTELVSQLFHSKNLLADVDLRVGKMLTVATIFRGRMSPKEVDTLMTNVRNQNSNCFVEWIPNNIKTAICDIPPKGLKMSATFIGNTTGIKSVFDRMCKSFKGMYQRKAYMHWYTGEGMEEQEFDEAYNCVEEFVKEYDECDNADKEKDNVTACPACSKFSL